MRLAVLGTVALALWVALPLNAQLPQQPPGVSQAPSRPGVQAPVPAPGAPDAQPTGIISGRVTAADTGAAIRRAQLRLSSAPGRGATAAPEPRFTVTDDAGQYEFKELPAGRYSLTVTRNGYVSSGYGVRPPSQLVPQPIELTASETLNRIDVALSRGGVAVVTVTDADGEPLAALDVSLLQPRIVNGQRSLGVIGTGESNDLGRARVFGLAPGEYYVSAQPALGLPNRSLPNTYYPGVLTVEEAQRVQITAGQETYAVVPIVAAKLARISGVVRTSDGQPLRSGLSQRNISSNGSITSTVPLRPDGSFEIRDLAPGRYELLVGLGLTPAATTPNPLREFARVPLTMAGTDITGLLVTTGPGASVSGRIAFDTGKPPDSVNADMLRVFLSATDSNSTISTGQTTMHDDFSFDLDGVAATGILRVPLTTGWFVKSVEIDGKDTTNTPMAFENGRGFKDVEIVLTQKRATVVGQALDGQSRGLTNYAVVLFPEERQFWYARSPLVFAARSDQAGAFKIEGVPAGRYLVVAVDRLETNEQQDPDLLVRLAPRATAVTVRDGESKAVSLRVEAR